jgi:drug/metabolite transporter (DMT)-like permease
MNWLLYALLTVACWGVYGIFLHTGTLGMADPANGRLKAFLLVGLAYFLTAVLAPIGILMAKGADVSFWHYPAKGLWWSLVAGIVGAIGALGVLLAFGVGGKPAVVMSIIFAGAPIVNAVVAILQHPPAGGWSAIKPQFFLGIVLAAVGAGMVMYFKPNPAPAKPTTASVQPATPTQPKLR